MRIEIEIPKEFEEHFNNNKFKDSFERIMADIEYSLEDKNCLCARRCEFETMEMLKAAFENSKPAYNIDKVVRQLNLESVSSSIQMSLGLLRAITIIKQSRISDDNM